MGCGGCVIWKVLGGVAIRLGIRLGVRQGFRLVIKLVIWAGN